MPTRNQSGSPARTRKTQALEGGSRQGYSGESKFDSGGMLRGRAFTVNVSALLGGDRGKDFQVQKNSSNVVRNKILNAY
jgi:hypothetical protein